VEFPSYSVDGFAEAENISRSMVYKLWSQGKGPRFYYVGNVRRISHQARIEWQREREADVAPMVPIECATAMIGGGA
jgi:hypothetical protein